MLDPVTLMLVPGLAGGVLLALLIRRLARRGESMGSRGAFDDESLSADVINAAHIKVAGIGGLGLVAMAAAVALSIPRVGQTMAIGLVSGAVLAAALILWRRREGPLPSSGKKTGANTILAIDDQPGRERQRPTDLSRAGDGAVENLSTPAWAGLK